MFSRPLFHSGGSRLRVWVASAKKAVEKRKQQFASDRVFQPSWRHEMGLTRRRRLSRGDQNLREILRLLDGQGVVRHDDQITFHNMQIRALLPKIYGAEWRTESQRVMNEFGMAKREPWLLIFARRRLGKTYSVAMLVTALLLVLEKFEVTVISTGGRISKKIRETCRMLMNNVAGANERVFITGEYMYVRARSAELAGGARAIPYSKGVSVLSTYPSDADRKPPSSHFSHPTAAAAA